MKKVAFVMGALFLMTGTAMAGPPIVTPEPMTMLLVGLGIAGLAAVRRFKK